MPDINVIDRSFDNKGCLDICETIDFPRKLWEIGTFEIHASLNATDAIELQEDRIIFIDEHRAGIITYKKITESVKGNTVMVQGDDLKGIVKQRITVPDVIADTQFFGWDRFPRLDDPDAPAETVIKHYVDKHMVNPCDANRKYPGLVIAPDLGRGPLIRWQSRWESLDKVFKSIGEQCNMGYEVYLDLVNKQFVFDVIPETNKTGSSSKPVTFATSWGNTESTEYTVDQKEYKNTGYAGGAGEDEGRLIQTVYEDVTIPSGFDRRETFLDCGGVDCVDDLVYEGKYKLKDKEKSEGLSGNTVGTGAFEYLEDWNLGDKVTVKSDAAGVEINLQITGVNESYQGCSKNIKPVFGSRPIDILDEIRKTEVVR